MTVLRRIVVALTLALLLFSPAAPALAGERAVLTSPGVAIETWSLEFITNRAYVPVRLLAALYGPQAGEVVWDPARREAVVRWPEWSYSLPAGSGLPPVIVTVPGRELKLRVGDRRAVVDGRVVDLGAAPVLRRGRLLVPLRGAVEALGGQVQWDPRARRAVIRWPAREARVEPPER